MMDKMFSTTLEKSGCYCVRLCTETQNHRIPRTPHALFMCYEKTWLKRKKEKKNGKQPCSTFTVSYHVKCEEGGRGWERATDGGKESRGEWFSSSTDPILMVTGDRALRNTSHPPIPPSPPPPLMPVTAPLLPSLPFSRLEECVKCPPRGTDSKTVFTRSTLSPLLTACEELLPPPLMCKPNGEELAGSHCICYARQRELIR